MQRTERCRGVIAHSLSVCADVGPLVEGRFLRVPARACPFPCARVGRRPIPPSLWPLLMRSGERMGRRRVWEEIDADSAKSRRCQSF